MAKSLRPGLTRVPRVPLITLGLVAGAIACGCFALARQYWHAVIVGCTAFSLCFALFPQMMAHVREYADQYLPPAQVALYNSATRACFAFAWIGGPPLGFFVYAKLGFFEYALTVAGLFVGVALFAFLKLPRLARALPPSNPEAKQQKFSTLDGPLIMALVAFSLLGATNHSYLIALPLLLSQELGIEALYAGKLMGLAAALEIPIMLMAGYLATKQPLIRLIQLGAFSATVLFIGLWQAQSLWLITGLQLFNALFIGLTAGLGVTWFQDYLPEKTGAASAYYSNTIHAGNIVGAVIIGLFASLLGYQTMFIVNVVASLIALCCLSYIAVKTNV